MALTGFTSIPEDSTLGGAPIDAFQADAFRRNDKLFEEVLQGLLASPFMPSGTDGDLTDPNLDPRQFFNAKNITVNTVQDMTANPKIPLIWFARESIIINADINGKGAGAQAGEKGDFGGSGGGGGANAGEDCVMPFTSTVILAGGTATNVGRHFSTVDAWRRSRAMMYLPYLRGGAAGGDSGGAGGGVVCLCSPLIELRGTAKIDVSGGDAGGGGHKGGGGGGLVILIARKLVNMNDGANVLFNGGAFTGNGKAGGNGLVIRNIFE